MPTLSEPRTGEVWDAQLSPTIGAEQAGVRPVLIISNEWFNRAENYLHMIVPITGTDRGLVYQHRIAGREGGLSKHSVVMCEQVRSVSPRRFVQKRGNVSEFTLAEVRRLVTLCIENNPVYQQGQS